jgi:hypothetical protein
MSFNDYANLTAVLDEIFEEHEVKRMTVNIETEDGSGFIVDCALTEAPPAPPPPNEPPRVMH